MKTFLRAAGAMAVGFAMGCLAMHCRHLQAENDALTDILDDVSCCGDCGCDPDFDPCDECEGCDGCCACADAAGTGECPDAASEDGAAESPVQGKSAGLPDTDVPV